LDKGKKRILNQKATLTRESITATKAWLESMPKTAMISSKLLEAADDRQYGVLLAGGANLERHKKRQPENMIRMVKRRKIRVSGFRKRSDHPLEDGRKGRFNSFPCAV